MNANTSYPLISVILTCYNHSHYLGQAIESVLGQDYPDLEVIVVDDGSTDDTRSVCMKYPAVRYIYQKNKGLSAARNTGIANSHGSLLVFLDADDWLLPNGIAAGFEALSAHAEAAFAFGRFYLYYEPEQRQWEMGKPLDKEPYLWLLESNKIEMHATVLYRRWVFEKFQFDKDLKACEDYDLYLKVTRSYPVIQHPGFVAVYRIHGSNMSSRNVLMLDSVLKVLRRQRRLLRSQQEKKAFQDGLVFWKQYYSEKLYQFIHYQIWGSGEKVRSGDLRVLRKYNPQLYEQLMLKWKPDGFFAKSIKWRKKIFPWIKHS